MADVRSALVVGLHRLVQDRPDALSMTGSQDHAISRASVVASFSLVLGLAITVGYVAWPRLVGALGVSPTANAPAYVAGQTMDVPAQWYGNAPFTLVVFARASCGACEKAQPFLAELVRHLQDRSDVVMAGPSDTHAEDVQYARSIGISDDRVQIVPASARVRATPTLVLVNREGQILQAWEGVGSSDHQAEIVKAVDSALR
jgi:peroxiredoxin